MKAHSETHFENENMFLEKWKVIIPCFKKLQKVKRKVRECLLAPNPIDW